MSTNLTVAEVALRLALTLVAGGLIGLNRTEGGRAAGLRTTILVCLAAAVSMIQANYLLSTAGKPPDSFIAADVLRLPLGVLSGMGFIGGGAILRRGSLVTGVTTAATLWFVTIMGLCFGGGQLGLGLTMLIVGLAVLWYLKWVEENLNQERRAVMLLSAASGGPSEGDVRQTLDSAGFRVISSTVVYAAPAHMSQLTCELVWRGHPSDVRTPGVVGQLAALAGVLKVEWRI